MPAEDNQFILRGFRGLFRMAQTWAPHLRYSVLFTRGEIPVHAEPIQKHCPHGKGIIEIMDAHHIHVTQLPHGLAAGYLQREGWDAVKVVLGGTKGWNSTACPLEL